MFWRMKIFYNFREKKVHIYICGDEMTQRETTVAPISALRAENKKAEGATSCEPIIISK